MRGYSCVRLGLATLLALVWLAPPGQFMSVLAQGTCSLSGTVYRDYNNTGDRTTQELGAQGVQVSAYNRAGRRVATTTSAADGQYTLNGLDENTEYRIEFTDIAAPLESGPFGSQSRTTVTFETCGAAANPVDLGVSSPGQYCQDNPDLATSCYVTAHQLVSTMETVISFPYNAGGATGNYDTPLHTNLARANQVGTTWGLAYHRTTQTLFAGAFQKRHTGYGPEGPGAIYAIRPGEVVSTFTNLPAGTNPHPDNNGTPGTNAEWLRDTDSWAAVGKLALGDLDMSEDDSTLYAVNLFDRQLYEITLETVAFDQPPEVASQTTYDLTRLPNNCPADDVRPFATAFHDGRVYVGMVCSAQSTQDADDLWAYVFSMPPGSGNFREEIRFPLNYTRRCVNSSGALGCVNNYPAEWNPWTDDFLTYGPPPPPLQNYQTVVYPQPMFTDIEIENGNLIMGFRDRFGDQAANLTEEPFDMSNDLLYLGIPGGDILRACPDGAGNLVLENNGGCGGSTSGGVGNDEGPGGGEFYFADNLEDFHDELFMGGLGYLPGQDEVAGVYFDPIPDNTQLHDAGVRWLSNTDGSYQRAYRVYNGRIAPIDTLPLFGKSNGLGDLEVMCAPAPIEIGNRVWFDPDVNGVQDPAAAGDREAPVPGVTVNLYLAGDLDNPIATTITSAEGEYYFNDSNVPDGLTPFTDYIIRLDNPADHNGGPLTGWFLTRTNADSGANSNIRDNDARQENIGAGRYPTIRMTTGGWGQNDHTHDFGFSDREPPEETPQPGPSPTPPEDTAACDPVLSKTASTPFAQVGDTVTWTITVSNPCNIPITDIQVIDTLPPGLQIVSVTTSAGTASHSGSTITVNIGTLGPGQSVTITIVTLIEDGTNVPFIFDNRAETDCCTSTARVIRASLQPATGLTPPMALIIGAVGGLIAGILLMVWRGRRARQR